MVECIFVSQVVIDSMGAGLVVILVTGYNIPQGPQKYSLAVQVLNTSKAAMHLPALAMSLLLLPSHF